MNPRSPGPGHENALPLSWAGVGERLRRTVAEQVAGADDPLVHMMACRVQASVLDCIGVFETMQGVLDSERRRAEQLERNLAQAQQALAVARAAAASLGAAPVVAGRAAFSERLAEALSMRATLRCGASLMVLNLDDFTSVNLAHGRAVGDQVLRIVELRLAHALREDDLVGRLDADQYACALFGEVGTEWLSHLSCKLLDAVAAPIRIGPQQLAVRPSIGVAAFPAHGRSAEALLARADAAMFRAKQQHMGYAFA